MTNETAPIAHHDLKQITDLLNKLETITDANKQDEAFVYDGEIKLDIRSRNSYLLCEATYKDAQWSVDFSKYGKSW